MNLIVRGPDGLQKLRACQPISSRHTTLKGAFLRSIVVALGGGLLVSQIGWAQPIDDGDGTQVTCNNYNVYGNPYFGDTHVHTTYSVDAYTQGVDTTPDQAYRFAKGETIGFHPFDEFGDPTRFATIDRPLDFAVVTDHAELFGERDICLDDTDPLGLYYEPNCVTLRERTGNSLVVWNVLLGAQQQAVTRFSWCGPDGSICTSQLGDTWQDIQDTAALHYDTSTDCSFTTFVGYEWTGGPVTPVGGGQLEVQNMHRNVLFRNSNVPARPYSFLEDGYPENLWQALEDECIDFNFPQGSCDAFTIPHNSNLSQGRMFGLTLPNGNPYGILSAKRRREFEPLIEIMQHKGQSECLASSPDELCDFEALQWGHVAAAFLGETTPKVEGTVRDALKQGLGTGLGLGFNPFMYGMIASSDTHLGAPGHVEEAATYLGHGGAAGGVDTAVFEGITDTPELNPGGLAVVWAPQNSRGALFDAMQRREVYGTSGPRHVVRFYGTWDIQSDICAQPNLAEIAYNDSDTVPMGATLPKAGPGQTVPQFLVSAAKDPLGNDLQRIQIIKGWKDAQGDKHELVYDIAGNPNNGAGVDLNSCATTGTGSQQLCQLWQDPDFDPAQRAFYYARVVENPSCRWTHRQCLASPDPIDCDAPVPVIPEGYEACCDVDVPKTVQERSWASPIWYEPPIVGC